MSPEEVQGEQLADAKLTCERVLRVMSDPNGDKTRKEKLMEMIKEPKLPDADKGILCGFLADHHCAFNLDPGD